MVAQNSLINLPKNKLLGISPVEHPCWNPHVWSSLFWCIPRSQKIGFSDTIRNQNKLCLWQKSTYFFAETCIFKHPQTPVPNMPGAIYSPYFQSLYPHPLSIFFQFPPCSTPCSQSYALLMLSLVSWGLPS